MFKKPLGQLKTSAPIRASDRRKLKQRVVSTFSANSEDGDTLVPDGVLTAKFINYAKEPGTLYLGPGSGNPLWFTLGKGSEDLIPTVYTLWKLNAGLLPSVLTPASVMPILVGGADLMVPGVITRSLPELAENQLVAIHQFSNSRNPDGTIISTISPPLAIGRMAVSSEVLKKKSSADEKGKAVLVLHTWKDHLWEMGGKDDPPPGTPLSAENHAVQNRNGEVTEDEQQKAENKAEGENKEEKVDAVVDDVETNLNNIAYTPQEVTDLLTKSLIHAIATQLSSLPPASFPIPSSQLYTNYILPCRPAYPTSVLVPAAVSTENADVDPSEICIDPSEITIKTSSHKSLTTFLKAAEKASLLAFKPTKHKSGSDLLVTSVNVEHPDVVRYLTAETLYVTVSDIDAKRAKRQAKEEEAEKERERRSREVEIKQTWKPHHNSVSLFEDMGASTSGLYSINDVRTLLNNYFTSKELINKHDPSYINLNPPLITCVTPKTSTKEQQASAEKTSLEFMKRDELIKKVMKQMQGWYEVKAEGKDVVTSKGEIKPLHVEIRLKPTGRRGITVITGFEPFLVIDADDMAEKFKKICAGSTSVSPYQVPGTSHQRLKVVVQGKQSKPIVDYLIERGIPKKWIEVSEVVSKK